MKNKKRILITGASGFIGSWVVKATVKQYNIVAVVSPFSSSERLNSIKDKIKVVKSDLSDSVSVEKLIRKYRPYAILHLATHGVYTYQQQNKERIEIGNYLMTNNLLSFAVKYKVKKFINTGTVFEYGSQNRKVSEGDVNLDDILNRYSAVKMATTALVNSYSNDLQVITLRPFTTYGPLEDETRFVISTIKRAINNEPLRIVKGVVRDFIYVEDVADAYVKSLKVNYKSGEVINIASGIKFELEKASLAIKRILNSKSEIIYDDKYIRRKESSCWANISKAKKILNWSPNNTFEQGIKKTIDSLK